MIKTDLDNYYQKPYFFNNYNNNNTNTNITNTNNNNNNTTMCRVLFDKIINSDFNEFKNKVNNDNINIQDIDGDTLLHISICFGNTNIVKYLLENNCNTRIKNNYKQIPIHNLHFLSSKNKILRDIISLFNNPKYNNDFNIQDEYGNTPLHNFLINIIFDKKLYNKNLIMHTINFMKNRTNKKLLNFDNKNVNYYINIIKSKYKF